MLAHPRTILCVDDDPDDQMLLLEAIKYIDPAIKVVSAFNGVEALRFLQEGKHNGGLPCLVIMDINMPQMDGRQALTLIRNDPAFHPLPVVMFTTSGSRMDQVFCERFGVPFFTKPSNSRSLEQTVRELLRYCAE